MNATWMFYNLMHKELPATPLLVFAIAFVASLVLALWGNRRK